MQGQRSKQKQIFKLEPQLEDVNYTLNCDGVKLHFQKYTRTGVKMQGMLNTNTIAQRSRTVFSSTTKQDSFPNYNVAGQFSQVQRSRTVFSSTT